MEVRGDYRAAGDERQETGVVSSALRVAIRDDYQDVALAMADWASLGSHVTVQAFRHPLGSEDAIAERLHDFDVIVAMRERTPFPSSLLARLPSLKLLVTTGRRNAAIDITATAARGVPVSGTGTMPMPPVERSRTIASPMGRRSKTSARFLPAPRFGSSRRRRLVCI